MKYIISILILCGYTAISQTPQTLNYQGYLADSNGDPVNGNQNITFRIYDMSNGGSALWTEARTVTLNDGVFSVVLGENSPINLPFDTQYWLGITVGGSELSPRTKLASSAYASNLPKVAFIKDVKAARYGGDFLSGAWRTRDLNELTGNTDFISLNANQFTLDAGTYIIEGSAPARGVNGHKAIIYNITDGTVSILGTGEWTEPNTGPQNRSFFNDQITIASQKVFEVRHQCSTTKTQGGLGISLEFGLNTVYTTLKITKIAN